MALHETHKRQLQRIMTDKDWSAVEAFLEDFMLRTFAQASIKRDTEFDTMWYAAEHEGGKRLIAQCFREMEEAAGSVETK